MAGGSRAAWILTLGILVAWLAAAACGDPAAGSASPVVRDSAGITIVENPAAAAETDLGWTVAPRPSLVVGVVEGAPAYQLHQVTGSARLPDAGIAVVNAGSGEVRFYDEEGRFQGAVGGQGDGPGEFRSMTLVSAEPGDSLLLYDGPAQRFTWVTAEPAVGRTFPSSDSDGGRFRAMSHGRLASGTIVATGPAIIEGAASLSSGVLDPLRHLLLLDPNGVATDTLGAFPHEPRHVLIGDRSINITRVPFGTVTRIVVGRHAIHVATADTWEIRTYDEDGGPRRLTRVDRAPRPVTAEDQEAAIAEVSAMSDRPRGVVREHYEKIEIPERMPAYGRILLDADDHLWVEEYRAPGQTGPTPWLVVDPDGRLLGTVATPEGLVLHEIGRDYLLGVALDELETQRVVMYPLERGPASS